MEYMKNFASIIIQKRKELGLTQEALAARLCITPQAVSKWENGVGLPDVTLFPAIAQVLGVTTDELFGIDHTPDVREIPEFPQKCAELSFIGSIERLACYSDKALDRVEGNCFYFTDGSVADLNKKEVRNCGKGEIRILEAEQKHEMKKDASTATTCQKELADFTSLSVSLSLPCTFCIAKGDTVRFEAEGTPTFIESIRAEHDGDTLNLTVRPTEGRRIRDSREDNKITLFTGFEKGRKCSVAIGGSSDVTIEPDFELMKLAISGSGDICGKNTDSLLATVNGSGDISLLTAKTANLLVNGSGDIDMKAVTESTEVKINGSGDIAIGKAKNTTLRITGSGDITIGEASGDLHATVNGSGDIEVGGGEVEKFTCTVAGSGDISAAKLAVMTADITTKGDSEATIVIGHVRGVSTEKISKNTTLVVKKRG